MESAVQPSGSGLAGLARQILTSSEDRAYRYLRRMWLASAARTLRRARREAGLSQVELAEKLGTTQSAVARLENDSEGRLSLHRYVDYAIACGQFPLEIIAEQASTVREFAIDDPDAPRTQLLVDRWRTQRDLVKVPFEFDSNRSPSKWPPSSQWAYHLSQGVLTFNSDRAGQSRNSNRQPPYQDAFGQAILEGSPSSSRSSYQYQSTV